jgi:uncharacterized protein (DUF2141 family)
LAQIWNRVMNVMAPLCGAVLSAASSAHAVDVGSGLHVGITGLRSDQGAVICYLFSSPAGFPADAKEAAETVRSKITGHRATCDFPAISPGRYAVAVVHDENGNGRLDRNALGLPSEGVGASNMTGAHMGPPSFAGAAFAYDGRTQNLSVRMNYLF